MSLIVKTVTRVTIAVILLFGFYLVLHGHITPGGGFAGGVIIALAYILYMLAFGMAKTQERLDKKWTSALEYLGALMFLGLALFGFSQGSFFVNFLPKGVPGEILSAGIIPLANIAIMLKVGAGLFGVFLALVTFSVIIRKEEDGE
ncbi:MAG: MnhB domain-containing protein [bacterium]